MSSEIFRRSDGRAGGFDPGRTGRLGDEWAISDDDELAHIYERNEPSLNPCKPP